MRADATRRGVLLTVPLVQYALPHTYATHEYRCDSLYATGSSSPEIMDASAVRLGSCELASRTPEKWFLRCSLLA